MSKIQNYHEKKELQEKIQKELEEMEKDPELKKEIEFKDRLQDLLSEYGKSADQMIQVMTAIDPRIAKQIDSASTDQAQKPKRRLKTYRNPHTGEVVQTRGGNQKTLKQWRDKYGGKAVESWLESVE